MSYKETFSIIIPTYSEKDNLRILIPILKKLYPDVFIFIVDDNSRDGTLSLMRNFSHRFSRIHLVARKGKLGRGSAVIDGLKVALRTAKTDYYLEMDADFSHKPQEIKRLLDKKGDNTLVIGSRYVKNSSIVNWPFWRRFLSLLANIYIRSILGIRLQDFTNGFRLYPKGAAETIVKVNPSDKGYTTLSETAYILFLHKFDFTEVPTTFINRKIGNSKISLEEYLQSLLSIIRIRQNYR